MSESRDKANVFKDRLRRARELRQLNQAELATRARLQPSAISHFETGTRQPSFDNLRRLADALAVSIDYLLGRSESISGVAQTTDVLYRNIEQLSTSDREVVNTIAKELVMRNKKGDGGGAGT
jgi:transcriptional regulator with XRE-family HTH domain